MSVKIWQRFRVTNGIGVEDGQCSARERRVNNDGVAVMEMADGG
jgi:hypothetical protein